MAPDADPVHPVNPVHLVGNEEARRPWIAQIARISGHAEAVRSTSTRLRALSALCGEKNEKKGSRAETPRRREQKGFGQNDTIGWIGSGESGPGIRSPENWRSDFVRVSALGGAILRGGHPCGFAFPPLFRRVVLPHPVEGALGRIDLAVELRFAQGAEDGAHAGARRIAGRNQVVAV